MSLYAKYLTERTEKNILETEHGFATYEFVSGAVYIENIYVESDYRKKGVASQMADKIAEIALKRGITKMLGSVCPQAKGSTTSLKALLAYGFELESASNNFIVLKKNLSGEIK